MFSPDSPDSPQELQFDLRCREPEWIDEPSALVDFARPAPAPDRYGPLAELLAADLIARAHYEISALAEGRVIISCETPRYGIPLGVRDLDTPPIDDWRIREIIGGDLLDAAPDGRLERSLAMQIRRGLIAVAGALPLLASPMLAHASAPAPADLAQILLSVAPPQLPADAQPAPAPKTEPAPRVDTPATTEAPPQPTQPSAPPIVPAPRVNDNLSLTGMAVWTGLLGKPIKLAMKNSQSLEGTVVAQSNTDLALARSSDGTIVAVPKSEVASVSLSPRAQATPGGETPVLDRPTQDGRGVNAGGIVMITFGSVAALAGTVFLALSPSYLFISLPLLLPGLAVIGGGASMMVSASKKKKAFNKAWGIPTASVHLTPTVGASRNGGQAGLILRF